MKKWKRMASVIVAAVLSLGAMCVPAAAATKITSVSVAFDSEGYDDEGLPSVYGTVKGEKYSVDGVMSSRYNMEAGSTAEVADDIYVVYLTASDGYYFSSAKSENIRVSGLGAQLISASRDNGNETLILRVRFTKAFDSVDAVEKVNWAEKGRGTWSKSYGAKNYIVNLNTPDGLSYQAETYGTSYDFAPFMQKEGSYTFSVRAVSMSGKKGEKIDSSGYQVSAEEAAANAARYGVEKEITYKDGIVEPSNAIVTYHNIGWQTEADGRCWYKNQNGSYPQEDWLSENGSWYYFGADGYMKANTYVTIAGQEYYFGPDGRMVASAATPDGRTAGADGVLPKK